MIHDTNPPPYDTQHENFIKTPYFRVTLFAICLSNGHGRSRERKMMVRRFPKSPRVGTTMFTQ